jgi:hypothetical protein
VKIIAGETNEKVRFVTSSKVPWWRLSPSNPPLIPDIKLPVPILFSHARHKVF